MQLIMALGEKVSFTIDVSTKTIGFKNMVAVIFLS